MWSPAMHREVQAGVAVVVAGSERAGDGRERDRDRHVAGRGSRKRRREHDVRNQDRRAGGALECGGCGDTRQEARTRGDEGHGALGSGAGAGNVDDGGEAGEVSREGEAQRAAARLIDGQCAGRAVVARAGRRHAVQNQAVGERKASDDALHPERLLEHERARPVGIVRELSDAVGGEIDRLMGADGAREDQRSGGINGERAGSRERVGHCQPL